MLLLARILKIFTGLECVATFHLLIQDENSTFIKSVLRPKIRKYQIYLRAFAPKAFIAYSSEIERFLLQDLGLHKNKVRKILAGTDTNYFRLPSSEERQKAREKFGFEEKDLVCTLVGRLNWIKGHDVLIDAVRQMRKEFPEMVLKCLFAGSGDREQEIKEYAFVSEDDSHSFIFAGYLNDMREVYWTSDIFVLPSRLEGCALVVAEAMCCGTVPIRTPEEDLWIRLRKEKQVISFPSMMQRLYQRQSKSLRTRIFACRWVNNVRSMLPQCSIRN
jgi:glycosyltransferase involved in cell wall biosynthesis